MAGITPMYAGQTLPVWLMQWLDDDGAAVSIVGAVLSLTLYNTRTGVYTQGVGAIQINGDGASAVYTWASSDTATPGVYQLYPVATFPNGVLYADPVPLTVLPV